jgi:hypothetical protein
MQVPTENFELNVLMSFAHLDDENAIHAAGKIKKSTNLEFFTIKGPLTNWDNNTLHYAPTNFFFNILNNFQFKENSEFPLLELKLNNDPKSITAFSGNIILDNLKKHPSIKILDLEGNNELGDGVALAIYKLLKKNTSLTCLNLKSCGLTDKSANLIAEGIKENTSLICIELGGNLFNEGFELIKHAAIEKEIILNKNLKILF